MSSTLSSKNLKGTWPQAIATFLLPLFIVFGIRWAVFEPFVIPSGSMIPNLLVPGVAPAICKASAKKVYIVNLMTKYGQTFGFKASDHVGTLEKYLGESCIDYVLINNTLLPKDILKRYKEEYDYPVADDLKDDSYKIIRTDLLAKDPIRKAEGDVLKRSLIRHDSHKLAETIMKLV